jgi:hypothetical protein
MHEINMMFWLSCGASAIFFARYGRIGRLRG